MRPEFRPWFQRLQAGWGQVLRPGLPELPGQASAALARWQQPAVLPVVPAFEQARLQRWELGLLRVLVPVPELA